MTNAQLIQKARSLTAARTTAQLVQDWIVADSIDTANMPTNDYLALSQMRGWVMDELEVRSPEAFAAWCDTAEMNNDDLVGLYENVA